MSPGPGSAVATPHPGRFVAIYAGLSLVLVSGVVGGIAYWVSAAFEEGPPPPRVWSAWRPSAIDAGSGVQEVAEHVSSRYRLGPRGGQLAAVVAGELRVSGDSRRVTVGAIAVRATPTSDGFADVFDASDAVQFELCGLADGCSLEAAGGSNASRERLLRREALELALYTFKYLPDVGTVIAYLPATSERGSTAFLFRPNDLIPQLIKPLGQTLPPSARQMPAEIGKQEGKLVDRLTLPHQYSYEFGTFPDGMTAVALTPLA